MLACSCGEEFETNDEALDHVSEKHADVCDNHLQEYVEDSVRDAFEEMVSGEEEHRLL